MFCRCGAFFKAFLAFSLLQSLQPTFSQEVNADNSFVITNVSVLPMDTARNLENQTVLVVDGLISSVEGSTDAMLPGDIRRIDGRGLFLMPGLADLHVHLLHEDELVNYLAWGVTTIMHLGGTRIPGEDMLAFKEQVTEGLIDGPNVYATNLVLDGDPKLNSRSLQLTDPAAARQAVRDLKARGFDFVKIYNNIERPEFDAIIDEAGKVGLPVFGHIPRNFAALDALGGGQNAVAHTEEMFFSYFDGPRSTGQDMVRNYQADMSKLRPLLDVMISNSVATMPDLAFTFTNLLMWDELGILWNDPEFAYLHPASAAMWQAGTINRRDGLENFVQREQWKYELILDLTVKFQEAGVLQVVGTDASQPGLFPGKAVHRELTELVKAGLSNFEALAVGTRNAGLFAERYFSDSVRFGQILPGYRADLVLLEANPLEDVRNARKVNGVAVNGRFLARAELEHRRAHLKGRYNFLHETNDRVDAALDSNDFATSIKNMLAEKPGDQDFQAAIEARINSGGYSYAFADKLDKASQVLQMNTVLFPQSANTWDSLAEIRLQMGDRDAALEYYRKVLELEPDSATAAQAIDEILTDQQTESATRDRSN